MEYASQTEGPRTQPASAALRSKSAAMTDRSPGGDRLRGLGQLINGSPAVQRLHAVSDNIQRQDLEEEELVQAKSAAPAQVNNSGLPANLKSGIESLSGLSMDHVQVHRNSSRPAQLNAHAFAQGSDIHLAPGQDQHLPHEAWHVVQQAQGRVKPTMQLKGGLPINDDAGLEREADVMGARAMKVAVAEPASVARGQQSAPAASPVQRVIMQIRPPHGYQPFFNDDAVILALRTRASQLGYDDSVLLAAFQKFHKLDLRQYTVDEALGFAASDEAKGKEKNLQPESLRKLYQYLPGRLLNYQAWLFDDKTWEKRDETTKQNLYIAKQRWWAANALFLETTEQYRLNEEVGRRSNLTFEQENATDIAGRIHEITSILSEIDELVREPAPPPKTWNEFMGNDIYIYANGSAGTPIPVVFYKSEADYLPIEVPVNTAGVNPGAYAYPNGPTVTGRKGTYELKVADQYRFSEGTSLHNKKDSNTREKQVDINFALARAGVNMSGLDGDHVRDLGFGGKDAPDNYWPLKAEINRRPFLGWRGSYGLNYISSDDTKKTASITGLVGKWLMINGFMPDNSEKVPEIGKKPEPESGAIGEA